MNPAPGEMRVAVIIPTLNEVDAIGPLLEAIAAQTRPGDELIVADGGSTDGTLVVAHRLRVRIVISGRKGGGRGRQIAVTLMAVEAEVVIVLHADMTIPPDALDRVREHLASHPDCPGGCLGHRFDASGRLLRLTERWDERRARRGMSYGDQAQFFRRELLETVGGFPDQPILEDVELSRRLRRLGRPAYLDCPVVVSARRFRRLGWLRTIIGNFFIRVAYRLFGVRACRALYRVYYRQG